MFLKIELNFHLFQFYTREELKSKWVILFSKAAWDKTFVVVLNFRYDAGSRGERLWKSYGMFYGNSSKYHKALNTQQFSYLF